MTSTSVGDLRIGLEVHVQVLSLKTKLFCSCSSDYREKPPNSNVCPVCMGLPGTLPTLNGKIVEEAAKVALALHCHINRLSRFYRKNYFYPDMAKNYQISQYDKAGGVPFAQDCRLELAGDRVVRIRRVHIEEDPARIYYEGNMAQSPYALVDYNRHGIALLEIVTEPDMTAAEEAREFLEKLASILEYLGVYRPGVEGALRCDVNVSVRGGSRVEVKNVSGFAEVERAVRFEEARQKGRSERGMSVEMETRHWDEARKITVGMRSKEEEAEYRYFPEPDLPPIIVGDDVLERAKRSLPELPDEKRTRYMREYGLSRTLAETIAYSPELSELFAGSISTDIDPRSVASVVAVDLPGYANERKVDLKGVSPELVRGVARLLEDGVDHKDAKDVLFYALDRGVTVDEAKAALGIRAALAGEELEKIVDIVMKRNPRAVDEAKRNPRAVDYLVGMTLKEIGGRTSAKEIAKIISRRLSSTSGS